MRFCGMFAARVFKLLFLICCTSAQDASTFCLTVPRDPDASPHPLTTLHQSFTSTETKVFETTITYTLTNQVPDHTVTTHKVKTVTKTVEGYLDTYTSTIWDGTSTETLARPTVTIFLDPEDQIIMNAPVRTTSKHLAWREIAEEAFSPDAWLHSSERKSNLTAKDLSSRQGNLTARHFASRQGNLTGSALSSRWANLTAENPAPVAKRDLPDPESDFDTVLCNTIHYETTTEHRTMVASVVNSGRPKRTITITRTYREDVEKLATPPGTITTVTSVRRHQTYTTTFAVVTSAFK